MIVSACPVVQLEPKVGVREVLPRASDREKNWIGKKEFNHDVEIALSG